MTESGNNTELIHYLWERTSSETGHAFLRALARSAASALKVAGAWVTEYLPERKVLRALAFWMNDHYVEDYEYSIEATPCEQVIQKRCLVCYPDRVIDLFPNDPDLVTLGAVSYVGVPLLAADGTLLGHLSALDTKPFDLTSDVESVFRIFASRAAAELVRIKTDSEIRASEQRLSQLFESTMDAILELDQRFRILRANTSTTMLFGIPLDGLVGQDLCTLLTEPSNRRLSRVADRLADAAEESGWVPQGLETIRPDGSQFQAEGSISRFEVAGECRYSLILRNVHEQLAAEDALWDSASEMPFGHERSGPRESEPIANLLGDSPAVRELVAAVRQVAATPTTVLITGETGTGKEVVAHAIHRASQRSSKPFVRVNCAAIPATLWESEFFGHEKGAFTGAVTRRAGRFELAQGGIIFLDEVGEVPLELQAKLLRVLQEHEYEPVGSSQTRKIDVRVIAATNRDLYAEVVAGRFREDLFYRLNVFPITVPSLRERGSDVELLARCFVERFSASLGKPQPDFTADCLRRLRAYHWPGNVRELENVMERAVIMARDGKLDLRRALPSETIPFVAEGGSLRTKRALRTKRQLREIERETIIHALQQANWKVAGEEGAARAMGVPPSTLASRMKAFGIQRPVRPLCPSSNSRIITREIESGENSIVAANPEAHANA